MKVACLRENLIRGLGASGGAIPSRTAMDILRNVLIDPWEIRLKNFRDQPGDHHHPLDRDPGGTLPGAAPARCAHTGPGPHCCQARHSTPSVPGHAGSGHSGPGVRPVRFRAPAQPLRWTPAANRPGHRSQESGF